MTANGHPAELGVMLHIVPAPNTDGEELADSVAMLRQDLLDLDVDAVEPLREEQAPGSSKGAAAAVAGWLAVNLGPVALRSVVDQVAAWARRNHRTVEIALGADVLKLTGVSQDQQDRLIDDWIARRGSSS